jgi:hypothetical protein
MAAKKAQRKKSFISVVRDAITGRFTTKSAAKKKPRTTTTERVRRSPHGKP